MKIYSQPMICDIKHLDLSSYLSVLSRIKFGVSGQESNPQSKGFHTARSLGVILLARHIFTSMKLINLLIAI